jgi:hypothetical protein
VVGRGIPGISRQNVRLREFVPSCSRPTTTYTERQLHEALVTVGLAPAKSMALEVRCEGTVRVSFSGDVRRRCSISVHMAVVSPWGNQKWEEFNPNEMVIRVTRWEEGSTVFPGCTGWAESALTPTKTGKCGGMSHANKMLSCIARV